MAWLQCNEWKEKTHNIYRQSILPNVDLVITIGASINKKGHHMPMFLYSCCVLLNVIEINMGSKIKHKGHHTTQTVNIEHDK